MTNRIIQKFKFKIQSSQRCPNCYQQLQQLDNLKYCQKCKQCPSMMDNFIRQPNNNIRQNIIELKLKGTGKIEAHVRDIFCKLNMRASESETNSITQKVLYLHRKRGPNCKGYKQQTAAVIYKQFSQQIRMSIFQYCNKTGLSRRKFNKMYAQYQKLLKQTMYNQLDSGKKSIPKKQHFFFEQQNFNLKQQLSQNQQSNQQIKNHCDNQELKSERQQQNYQIKQQQSQNKSQYDNQKVIHSQINTQINSMLKRCPSFSIQQYQFNIQNQRQTIRKTIQKIYDKIFTSFYLAKFKKQLIESIVQKSVIVSKLYIESRPLNYLKKYFRIPSIIFCVIKANKYKISCKKYINLVQKNLDVKITENMINKFMKLSNIAFSRRQQDQDVSSPTTLQNRNHQSQRNHTSYSNESRNELLY